MADILIDGTAGTNQFIFLDTNGKIPALDGRQVTNITAGNITTGTIPLAIVPVGTGANQILQVAGDGKLPAVDGSQITNVASATKSSSDPTISTNPSGGVGTEGTNGTKPNKEK